ncbi:MAG: hypothetical protein PHX57_13050, partial [Desulfobulbaceae bacterium]|nr:hypothetical protein [Desulfobulbaceae bacterium]
MILGRHVCSREHIRSRGTIGVLRGPAGVGGIGCCWSRITVPGTLGRFSSTMTRAPPPDLPVRLPDADAACSLVLSAALPDPPELPVETGTTDSSPPACGARELL